PLASPAFCAAVLRAISRNRVFTTARGAALHANTFPQFAEMRGPEDVELSATTSKAEQSNTSVLFGNRLILKVFRRIDEGINPDQEVGRYLTDVVHYPNTAPVVGAVEFRRKRKGEPMTLAILQGFVPNQGDAWQYTLDVLSSFYERALAVRDGDGREPPAEPGTSIELSII